MTFKRLEEIMKENNIPKDVTLMSDSGWECDATDMNGMHYNKSKNVIIFTQGVWSDREYTKDPNWVCLHTEYKEEE